MVKIVEKSLIAIMTGLLIMIMCSPVYAAAKPYTSGYYNYTIDDESVTITGYFGKEESIVIPSSIAGYPVSTIKKGAFTEAKDLKKITLPDTIMTVERNAFREDQKVIYSKKADTDNTSEKETNSSSGNDGTGQQSNEGSTSENQSGKSGSSDSSSGNDSDDGVIDSDSDNIVQVDEEETKESMDESESEMSDLTSEEDRKTSKSLIIGLIVLAIIAEVIVYSLIRARHKRDKAE